VEKGFSGRGYDKKPPLYLTELLTVYQTEFQSIVVNLTYAIVSAPPADDSDGRVSSADVQFGVGPEDDITEEDRDDQGSCSDDVGSLDDNLEEEQEETIDEMSITPLPNMR
jgi:hypothetical protein